MNEARFAALGPKPSASSLAKAREFYHFKERVENKTWEQIIDEVSSSADAIISKRKKELLQSMNPTDFLASMPKSGFGQLRDYSTFRGCIFESLVNQEMNDEEENGLLGNFILHCLKNPRLLGIDEKMLQNPDHLGVVVDAERNIAYIKGMYEVKIATFGPRSRRQLSSFYKNLAVIAEKINAELRRLKEEFNFDFIPDGGVVLKSFEEIDKFVVVPLAVLEKKKHALEKKRFSLKEQGWGLRQSVFTNRNIGELTAFLMNYYEQHKEEIDKKRKSNKLST
ncbi:MAG: hypothetical protein ACOZBH_03240 [Patescibacteria group bacterium]